MDRLYVLLSSPNAQNDIETLAERTNGKAFSVPDGTGPDAINDPLSGENNFDKLDLRKFFCRIIDLPTRGSNE